MTICRVTHLVFTPRLHCYKDYYETQIYFSFPPFGDTQVINCVAQGKVTQK